MRKNKTSDYWLCKCTPECSASATIGFDNRLLRKTDHYDHMPEDPCKLDVLKSLMVIRDRIKNEKSKSIKSIFEQVRLNFVSTWGSQDAERYFPSYKSVAHNLAKQRSKSNA